MRRPLLALLLLTFCMVTPGFAQDRTTVFIHGLGSNPATWDSAIGFLSPQLAIRPLRADLDWKAFYESQANELEQELGSSVPGDAIAVGHSNGGVVARQWSRIRNLDGIITLGSPNQGAPIVDHVFEWLGFLDDVLLRISNVRNVFANNVSTDAWWWLPAQWTARFGFAVDVWNTAGNGLFSLGYDYRQPVMPEMRVASAFMANLNSASNRDREALEAPARAAIVNVARDFYNGGPFRTLDPAHYGDWHLAINFAGIGLEGLAGVIRIVADIDDVGAFDLADHVSTVAEWFLQFEEVWCRSVSDPSPLFLGRCYEHDGIVPAWSQAYDHPRLPLIVTTDGPVHTDETKESHAQLYQALTTIARVGLRTSAPPPSTNPPPPPPPPPPPTDPPPPPPPDPTGRYKLVDGACLWDAYDSGPNQCNPSAPTGRYKFDGSGGCYWEPNDYPPDQCSPPPPHVGRYKLDGNGSCYWEPNDDGPHQCVP